MFLLRIQYELNKIAKGCQAYVIIDTAGRDVLSFGEEIHVSPVPIPRRQCREQELRLSLSGMDTSYKAVI